MRLFAIVLALCAVAPFAQQQAPQPGPQQPKKPPVRFLGPPVHKPLPGPAGLVPSVKLMRAVWDAWQTLDVAKAAPFYAKDPGLLFFDIAPLKYQGWDDYQKGATALVNAMASMQVTIDPDAQVHMVGTRTAWGAATLHAQVAWKGGDPNPQPLDLRYTVIWEKRGTLWLIVHEQISAPMPSGASESKPSPQAARQEFLIRILPVRLTLLSDATEEEKESLQRHFEYLQGLQKAGTVSFAGRTDDPKNLFGFVIVEVTSAAEASQIAAGDPAVQAGIFREEVFPFKTVFPEK